jgi:hypothetical protein
MPPQAAVISLDIILDRKQAARVRQGYIPAIMEEKWFAYFEDNVLYQHRSWTGICIDQIHFVSEGAGLRATHARVNRDPRQYGETDDAADVHRITEMVLSLANLPPGAKSTAVDPFVEVMTAALRPNYLGSPEVIHRLVKEYVDVLVANWRAGHNPETELGREDEELAWHELTEIVSGNNLEFVAMPWHSKRGIGKNVIEYMEMDQDDFRQTELYQIILTAVRFFGDAIQHRLATCCARSASDDEVSAELKPLTDFFETVLLGTNAIYFPGKKLCDFTDSTCAERG